MAVGKEIKKKIGSVGNTKKITSAMQMVAASKMRRTQERMREGKPYAEKIRAVIGHLANSNPGKENAVTAFQAPALWIVDHGSWPTGLAGVCANDFPDM